MFFKIILSLFCVVCLNCVATNADLPLIQISHDDLDNDYPEMREEVHLEDFFWTGSGDGPPDYLKKVHTGISKGKDVVVKTETVVATVYVDGNNEIDIPICLDCPPDDNGGVWNGGLPLNYSATDRRYWLLTVMSGFYSQKDNPKLEEKLARLYRLAFTRQQSKHLGINGSQQISSVSGPISGEKKKSTRSPENSNDFEMIDMTANQSNSRPYEFPPHSPNAYSELISSSEEVEMLSTHPPPTTIFSEETTVVPISNDEATVNSTKHSTSTSWELIQEDGQSEKLKMDVGSGAAARIKKEQLIVQNHFPPLRDDRVRVVIHNITHMTAEEIQKGNLLGLYEEDVNEKIDDRPAVNQTELIYSVFVNGRPVLAVTAANDMKLVSESEVTEAFGNDIIMKAEPYLREPQATPLAPATRSGSIGFVDSFRNNTALVVVTSLAILLLLLLLLLLAIMGRSTVKRKEAEVNRSSSRNDLLSDTQSIRPTSSVTAIDTGRSATTSRDVGIQNMSFEKDERTTTDRRMREARIHFPGPPTEAPDAAKDSLTSSDNTSDSSVYCPINPPPADVQRMLDQKAAKLFEKHRKRHHHQYDRAEGREDGVYTAVVSEKARKKSRQKAKKRYLSDNRVGSVEGSPAERSLNSSGDDLVVDEVDLDSMQANYGNTERTEAFNPSNNYHRNKLLHQRSMHAVKEYPLADDDELQPTEAYNKEMMRAMHHSRKSSDTGSIGSFLSMASVKAFPKSTLPEPLNRVLDPVFVTYYDNVEESARSRSSGTARQQSARSHQSQKAKSLDTTLPSLDASSIAVIESLPSPKDPRRNSIEATQSDNPDPGVIGPVVWERHKKRMSEAAAAENLSQKRSVQEDFSPVHDPAAVRSHFEGLIEGAIQMYSSHDDLPMPLPDRDFTNKRRPTRREFRGSSAGAPSFSTKAYSSETRPSTAQPEKTPKSNQSTVPPSPSSGAWGGSLHGSNSPIIRPMSAGPFHRPDIHQGGGDSRGGGFSKPPSRHGTVSAAPLIEAIQIELYKYKQTRKEFK